jgi:hypothetical protein
LPWSTWAMIAILRIARLVSDIGNLAEKKRGVRRCTVLRISIAG